MTAPVVLTIPGRPVPLDRHRHGANGRGYNTRRVTAAKDHIRALASVVMRGREPLTGPCILRVEFWRDRKPDAVPDLSQYVKLVEDGLTGVAYRDDCQIVEIIAFKRRAENPHAERTVVTITPLEVSE